MNETLVLNDHNKKEYPPMHTAEHLLNATMVRLFGCERSKNTHIERKKSKCDYLLDKEPTELEMQEIVKQVNQAINRHLHVEESFMKQEEAKEIVDLSKLPEDASDLLRIIRIGDYDACACIGDHVKNTSEIGEFHITTYTFNEGVLRIRFKLK